MAFQQKPKYWPVTPALVGPRHRSMWSGLVACYPFLENGGRTSADWAGAGGYAIFDSTMTWTMTPIGPAPYFDNSASPARPVQPYGNSATSMWHDLYTEQTMFCALTFDADAGGPLIIADFGNRDNGSGFYYKTSPNTFHYGVASGGTRVELSSLGTYTPDSTGRIYTMSGRYDKGAMSFWLNGAEQATGSNGTSFDSDFGTGTAPTLGAGSAGTDVHTVTNTNNVDEWGGNILCWYIWDRALNNGELAELHRDPYCIVRPARHQIIQEFIPLIAPVSGAVTPDPLSVTISAVEPTTVLVHKPPAVSATISAVVPGTISSLSQDAVSVTISAVEPTTDLVHTPVAASVTVTAVMPVTGVPAPAVSVTISAVEPTTDLAHTSIAVSATISAVEPTTDLVHTPAAASVTISAIGPAIITPAAAVSVTISAVEPTTDIAHTPVAASVTITDVAPNFGMVCVETTTNSVSANIKAPTTVITRKPSVLSVSVSVVDPFFVEALSLSITAVTPTVISKPNPTPVSVTITPVVPLINNVIPDVSPLSITISAVASAFAFATTPPVVGVSLSPIHPTNPPLVLEAHLSGEALLPSFLKTETLGSPNLGSESLLIPRLRNETLEK